MSTQSQKEAAAAAAIAYLVDHAVVGVGSGSTVNLFIAELGKVQGKYRIRGAVAASAESERRLREHHIDVLDLNMVDELPVYVDGADEITPHLVLVMQFSHI